MFHPAFLYEIKIWHGAKITAEIINKTDRLIIPLNKNTIDGSIDNANARNTVFL